MSKNEKQVKALEPYRFKPKWNSETKAIRVPVKYTDHLIKLAHWLDNNDVKMPIPQLYFLHILEEMSEKIDERVHGYKTNSATALVRQVKTLHDMAIADIKNKKNKVNDQG